MGALDPQDQKILEERQAALDQKSGPRVGDWVEFADGVTRRISYLWPEGVQTSDGGSFYLDRGSVSMSGSLYPTVPRESLTRTERSRPGSAWFFHHDYSAAGNSVEVSFPFRVYGCDLPAPH